MRLWHYRLIEYLPDLMLLAQWRELCAIAKRIKDTGTPGHRLVNQIMEHPWQDLHEYSIMVEAELRNRGYNLSRSKNNYYDLLESIRDKFPDISTGGWPFVGWHTDRYLTQCVFNLEEKYDCGIISKKEWEVINRSTPVIHCDGWVPF